MVLSSITKITLVLLSVSQVAAQGQTIPSANGAVSYQCSESSVATDMYQQMCPPNVNNFVLVSKSVEYNVPNAASTTPGTTATATVKCQYNNPVSTNSVSNCAYVDTKEITTPGVVPEFVFNKPSSSSTYFGTASTAAQCPDLSAPAAPVQSGTPGPDNTLSRRQPKFSCPRGTVAGTATSSYLFREVAYLNKNSTSTTTGDTVTCYSTDNVGRSLTCAFTFDGLLRVGVNRQCPANACTAFPVSQPVSRRRGYDPKIAARQVNSNKLRRRSQIRKAVEFRFGSNPQERSH